MCPIVWNQYLRALARPPKRFFHLLNSPNRPFLFVLSHPRVAVLASRSPMWDFESYNGQKTLRMTLVSSLFPSFDFYSLFIIYLVFQPEHSVSGPSMAGYGLYWRILILIAYVSHLPIYGMFSARSTRPAFKASTVLTVWKGGYLSSGTYIGPHSYLIDLSAV